ncbi:DUF2326 domain-containing protein [Marinobacterium litorale]|uniref:DUF2326 domain-containing protein n=1 Tax=Marinobacterium litorale TaxID=404770 RepID=UPI000407FC7A|nr:DUF2326 domain-containing protein [Marinobacterium litorale]
MRLVRLSVYKNGELIRLVPFKKGLNLILNSASISGGTGNSVGKSTPSRLLDYLFLSSGEDIYTEAEFGKPIPVVFSLINDNTICVELEFEGFDQKSHKIARTLTTDPKTSIYYIDSRICEKSDYIDLVAKQIFGQTDDKPSIRNISHKFIRNTNDKMQNTTRFLHGNTKPDIYDQMYLFLFGFSGLDLLKEKASLNNRIRTKKKHLAAYRNPYRESALQRMIAPLKVEEDEIQKKINEFDFSGSQDSSVKELVGIQNQISDLTISYSKIKTRLNYLNKSVVKVRESATSVDGKELATIYAEAGVAISDGLKRSFEDLVVFHNKVISNKLNLLENDMSRYQEEEERLRSEIDSLHRIESGIFKHIKQPDTLKSIGILYNDLTKIKEKIAGISALLDKIEDANAEIQSLEDSKLKVVQEISKNTEDLDSNVEIFNEYFGELSKYFYGDRYIFDLEFDLDTEKCRFDIANISPNPTGGKKKGELSAFDLAYIKFVTSTHIKRPSFVVHDSIEDVDVNQVFDIFKQADSLNGQYVVALLSDKLADSRFDIFKKESTILELSENDKFFRI